MEESKIRKEIKRLENLLDGRRIGMKTMLKLGLATALAFLPAVPVKAYIDHVQSVHQTQVNKELDQIKRESIEKIFDMDEHKKYEQEIREVSQETNVPGYILKAIVDEQRASYLSVINSGENAWVRSAVTDAKAEHSGIRLKRIEEDPKQAILGAAKIYKESLKVYGNEEEALIRYACLGNVVENDWVSEIKKAKRKAGIAQRMHEKYEKIKKNPRYAELVSLVEKAYRIDEEIDNLPNDPGKPFVWVTQHNALRKKYKCFEISKRIDALAKKEFGRGDFFAYLHMKHTYEKDRWWINASAYGDLVKRALKFKRAA